MSFSENLAKFDLQINQFFETILDITNIAKFSKIN
jgi:hypothetical protein